jgi:hypothetical protein
MLSLDTHSYDNNKDVSERMKYLMIFYDANDISFSSESIKKLLPITTHSIIDLIMNGPAEDEKEINVHVLLYLLYKHLHSQNSQQPQQPYIIEQLEDIRNGPCIQGRSMRLLQIVLTLY